MGSNLAFGNPRLSINGWDPLTGAMLSKLALPSLSEDMDRLLGVFSQKNKYHRKTNYKPKYTL